LAAAYFTLATTAVTHPSVSGEVVASSRVTKDSLVDVLGCPAFMVFVFVAIFF
jgi:hypothetical protein